LSKGRPIFVEGRLRQDTWTGNDGQKRSKIGVVCENFQFLGPAPGGGQSRGPAEGGAAEESPAEPNVEEDEIPF